jgi:formylglycine-generating enzyme required for sulfatase activity
VERRDAKLAAEKVQQMTELNRGLTSGRLGKVIEVWITPESKLSLCYIPPGSFEMGSPESEPGRHSDEKLHYVTLTQGFWISKYELTIGNWDAAVTSKNYNTVGEVPSRRGYGRSGSEEAAEVYWDDTTRFIVVLNDSGILPAGWVFALPTEAQWEYACRAGTTGPFAGNLDEMARYGGTDFYGSRRVGQKKPNEFGLYDIHGNLSEWVSDSYQEYPSGAVTDPAPKHSNGNIIHSYRGGNEDSPANNCRSADRDGIIGFSSNKVGIRLVVKPLNPARIDAPIRAP